jgi:hypothetical protein
LCVVRRDLSPVEKPAGVVARNAISQVLNVLMPKWPSCSRLSRASTTFSVAQSPAGGKEIVDGRHKADHDDQVNACARPA